MTAWKPLGDLNALLDLDGLSAAWTRAVPRILHYTDWAVGALADLTAVACELSNSKLEELERNRTGIGSFPDLDRRTRGDLEALNELGYVPWGAGLATVAQGVHFPTFVHKLAPLAQDWQDAGFRFPSAPFVIWTEHVPLLGGAS